jgi:hypothetical protein
VPGRKRVGQEPELGKLDRSVYKLSTSASWPPRTEQASGRKAVHVTYTTHCRGEPGRQIGDGYGRAPEGRSGMPSSEPMRLRVKARLLTAIAGG